MKKRTLRRLFTLSLSFITAFTSIPVSADTVSENDIQVEEIAVETVAEEESDDDILSDERYNGVWMPEDGHPGLDGFGLMPETNADADMLEAEGVSEYNQWNSVTQLRNDGFITSEKVASYGSKYDPRDYGKVTSVKNQGDWGLCWAYAANSTAESQLILKGYADSSIDLSEMYLAYAAYKTNWINSSNHYTFPQSCNLGGTNATSWKYFNEGYGPVLESRVPWQEPTDDYTLPDSVLNSADYECGYYYNGMLSSSTQHIENLKYMIKNYGGAELGINFYSGSTTHGFKYAGSKTADGNFYWPGTGFDGQNHAVSVIGWDDNYPATNFLTTAPGNGAWLVKNSYGSGNTKVGTGFFWVSYYDDTIDDDYCVPVLEKKGTYGTDIKVTSTTYDGKPLYVGDSFTFSVKAYPETATMKDYSFGGPKDVVKVTPLSDGKSCKVDIIGVPSDNKAKAGVGLDWGNFYKPVYSSNKIAANIEFTVNNTPVLSLTADDSKTISLNKGDTFDLTPSYSDGGSYAYSLASSDSSIVKVVGDKLTATGYGIATVTGSFSFKNAPTEKASVKVAVQPDMTVNLSDEETFTYSFTDYKKGTKQTHQLEITLNGEKVTDFTGFKFYSDGVIASCTDTGLVTVNFPYKNIYGLNDESRSGWVKIEYEDGELAADKMFKITSLVKACTHQGLERVITEKGGFGYNGYYDENCNDCGYCINNYVAIPALVTPSVNSSYTYTGSAIRPAITVKDENGNVIPVGNVTVTYGENVSGFGTVTVSVSNDLYESSIQLSFTITAPPVNNSGSSNTGSNSNAGNSNTSNTGSNNTGSNNTGNTNNSYNGNTDAGTGNGSLTKPNPVPVKVTVPKLTMTARKSGKKVKVNWGRKTGLYKVQVQIASNRSFTKNRKQYSVSGYSRMKSAKLLNTKYTYVRVRAVKKVSGKVYYGKWSSVRKVKK